MTYNYQNDLDEDHDTDMIRPTEGDKRMFSAIVLCDRPGTRPGTKVKTLRGAVILLHREGNDLDEIINIASMYGATLDDKNDIAAEWAEL